VRRADTLPLATALRRRRLRLFLSGIALKKVDCDYFYDEINFLQARRIGVSGLYAAHHNQPFNGGLIMTDLDIQKSRYLLKSLEEEMRILRDLMDQASVASSNLEGIWIAIEQTHENWKRYIEL
jgi:hypothetical protein